MLKHTDLTRSRIVAFLKNDLQARIFGERVPLRIEMSDTPAATQAEAEASSWREVAQGHAYGPAYTTFWFRLSGRIPETFAGETVVLFAEVGGERTAWKDGSPWCGIDHQHSDMGWTAGSSLVEQNVAQGGEEVVYYVQSYTRNKEVRVAGKEPPRSETTEVVEGAWLCTVDLDVKALAYDVEFALGLLDTIKPEDPAHATILRALNDVCNGYASEGVPRLRKILRDALGSLSGELAHTVVPVGHAHLDTAWLWPLEITRKKMAHTTATQLGLLERYPEYVFAHSQASQYEWLEQDYPALFERVKKAVKEGRWEVVGSMWVEADCNLTGAESLVRQFLYGKRYFRQKLGVETDDMWLPDVFGYSAALPQILAKFNISYFMTQKISWNQFNRFPHHTFWWQGIDGTKVWSHFPPADAYNCQADPKTITYSVENFKDHGRSDTSLFLFGWGDGGGGPTEKHLELLRRGRQAPNYPEIASGKRALDFFRDAKARSKDLLTWSGELYLELHRGTYTSQAANKKGNRESEFLLRDAEILSAFAPDYPDSYPQGELEAAWKLVLLNQFHDIIPGSSVREVYQDSARDYAEIKRTGERIVEEKLRALGSRLSSEGMARPIALFQNATQSVQGALPWTEETAPSSLVCGEESLPVQLIEEFGERKLIFPTPTAALGAVTVGDLSDSAPSSRPRLKAAGRKIENDVLSVRFDAHGNLTSIQTEDGTEFLEAGKLGNLFQIFEDKPNFWTAWDIDAFALETGTDLVKSESFEIVERGPVRAAVEIVKRFGKSTIRQRISLGPTPGVRFDTEIDWHEEDKMLKVAFPVSVNSPRATYEIQFGHVERPTHRNTSWDMARFEVCAQKWVDLSEGGQGVALMNDGKYGHDVFGNVMRMTLLRAPKAPDPTCDMGRHRFTYVLMPHFMPFAYDSVVPTAYALNAPLRVATLQSGAGEEGSLPPFVACDNRNVVIESVKKAEDAGDRIVRLYECHNTRGRAELSVAGGISEAWLCDLEENPIAELEVNEGLVAFDFKPFEILTIKFKP